MFLSCSAQALASALAGPDPFVPLYWAPARRYSRAAAFRAVLFVTAPQ